MATIASQITSLAVVYSTVYSDADQRKHQSSASLAFVWGIHRGPVNSPHKWPVTRKMYPFDDVIMHVTDDNLAALNTQVDILQMIVSIYIFLKQYLLIMIAPNFLPKSPVLGNISSLIQITF